MMDKERIKMVDANKNKKQVKVEELQSILAKRPPQKNTAELKKLINDSKPDAMFSMMKHDDYFLNDDRKLETLLLFPKD